MRIRILTFLAAAGVLGACQQPPQPTAELTDAQRDAIVSEVNEAVDQIFDAMNSHDSAAVMSHYLHSDDFSYAGVTDYKLGFEIFSRIVSSWYPGHPDVTFEHEILKTAALSPTSAVALIRGSSTTANSLLWTQVYVKQDGKWLIAHEHESWPMCVEPEAPHPMTEMPKQ
jgi:ketosteroid isomerase-like protein